MTSKISKRTRIFLAVEGPGDQSFVKWLQMLANQTGLHVHLDCEILSGGGYQSMLEGARRLQKRKGRENAKKCILLVDSDRADHDEWSIEQLRRAAEKYQFIVCVQKPNLEGVFLRLLSEKLKSFLSPNIVQELLRKTWPDYKKPADARTLSQKFSLQDLLRIAAYDAEIKLLIECIGLDKVDRGEKLKKDNKGVLICREEFANYVSQSVCE